MMAWEYRVEELSAVQIANQLNFIGNDGWELIHIQFPVFGSVADKSFRASDPQVGKEGEVPSYLCFFKREKDQGLF